MIKMQLLGNLGKDAELKHFGDDKMSVVNFSVAHTEKRKNAQGVKESITIWANCAWWLKKEIADKVAPYLKKGKKVYVEGEPGARAYIPTGGNDPKADLTLRVFSLEFAEAAQAAGTTVAPAAETPPPAAPPAPTGTSSAPEDDDLPF